MIDVILIKEKDMWLVEMNMSVRNCLKYEKTRNYLYVSMQKKVSIYRIKRIDFLFHLFSWKGHMVVRIADKAKQNRRETFDSYAFLKLQNHALCKYREL